MSLREVTLTWWRAGGTVCKSMIKNTADFVLVSRHTQQRFCGTLSCLHSLVKLLELKLFPLPPGFTSTAVSREQLEVGGRPR